MARPTRTPEGIRQVRLFEETFCCPVYLLLEVSPASFDAWLTRELRVQQAAGHPAYRAGQAIEVRDRDTRQLTALVISFNGRWCRSVDNLLVLMHEVHHCVTFLLHDRGLRLSAETEEVWAYLQDSLVRRFVDSLNPHNKHDKNRKDRKAHSRR